jgi:hypothetical protein
MGRMAESSAERRLSKEPRMETTASVTCLLLSSDSRSSAARGSPSPRTPAWGPPVAQFNPPPVGSMLASGGRGEEQAGSGIGGAVPVPVIWLSKRQGGWRRRTPPPAVAAVARTESRLVVWLRKEVKQSDEGRPTPALQMCSCSFFRFCLMKIVET